LTVEEQQSNARQIEKSAGKKSNIFRKFQKNNNMATKNQQGFGIVNL